ncbi:hypothetical protein, conserved [Eimeria praecox]|uniref:Transmembrane protein n=1 Tax=Eimeria praecox TaxID=51316 RepID=U6GRN6_9EIME|nr:hypothetical protein, conserved [Eimeria praecox]
MLAYSVILLLTVLPAAEGLQGSLPAATPVSAPGACSVAGDESSSCSFAVRDNGQPRTLRELEAYVALLEGKLEERLEKHEQQQWEQQRNLFVLLAVSICLAVVFIVALAACKVYVQSLQNQMQCSFQGEEELRGLQDSSGIGSRSTRVGEAPSEPPLPRDQPKLSSVEREGCHQKDRWSSRWDSEETHPTAANQFAFDDDMSDEPDLCLYPSREDVERAQAIEEVRTAAGVSPEVQQQQQELEARCSRLFERLHEITDVSRAFRSSSSSESEKESGTDPQSVGEEDETEGKAAAEDADSSGATPKPDTAEKPTLQRGRERKRRHREADPARINEQRELLQQLQQLFREIDATFISNKPAHVSVMIRCCNALLRADGLAVLKACADCQPLHKEAQSIIETVVPCIWAT